jgi:hypothetical protein
MFSLPLKGLEGNSESLLVFLFNGTEFRTVFSSAEGFGTEFREFLFRGTAVIPSEITICSVYSVFRGIIFLSEIPNPREDTLAGGRGGGGSIVRKTPDTALYSIYVYVCMCTLWGQYNIL